MLSHLPTDHVNSFFVIIYRGRSGSTFLASKLDSHPEILCHSELFHPDCIATAPSCESDRESLHLGTIKERDKHPVGFIHRVYSHPRGSRAVGFKMGLSHNKIGLLALILNRRIKKIVLQRVNCLDSYTSLLIARQTGAWAFDDKGYKDSRSNDQGRQPVRVHVDPKDFKRYVVTTRLFFNGVRIILWLTRQTWIDIEYNQIDDQSKIEEILRFLGVDAKADLRSHLKKQNPASQKARIENYEELEGLFWNKGDEEYLS